MLAKTLARLVNVPIAMSDATTLTQVRHCKMRFLMVLLTHLLMNKNLCGV